jgi:hypothetical protein
MISFPPIPVLNLTFLTPQPGALCPGIVQSHESSYNHPLALPVALLPFLDIPPGGARLRSVVNTFIGLPERTSHTATIPSWDATANLEPDGENAVQNEAGSAPAPCDGCTFTGVSKGGRVRRASGVNVIRSPPVMPCRYTCGESPTERRVRPSGEIEAGQRGRHQWCCQARGYEWELGEMTHNDSRARQAATCLLH